MSSSDSTSLAKKKKMKRTISLSHDSTHDEPPLSKTRMAAVDEGSIGNAGLCDYPTKTEAPFSELKKSSSK